MEQRFARKVALAALVVGGVVCLFALAYFLRNVLLIVFTAALFAVIFDAIAAPLRKLGLPHGVAVMIAVLVLITVLAALFYWFGATISNQFSAIFHRAEAAIPQIERWLAGLGVNNIADQLNPSASQIASQIFNIGSGAVGVVTNAVLVLIGAVYLALQPRLYVHGFAKLFPQAYSQRVHGLLDLVGSSLKRFLGGQLFTMIVDGVLIAIGLTILGIPSAPALGILLGLSNFVPVIGSFVGAVPGILVALTMGIDKALWALGLYLVVQQLEGNVLTPIVQRQAVAIPPALLIFLLPALGTLFGLPGTLLAGPLAVVVFVTVSCLWSRDTLGHEVDIIEDDPGTLAKANADE